MAATLEGGNVKLTNTIGGGVILSADRMGLTISEVGNTIIQPLEGDMPMALKKKIPVTKVPNPKGLRFDFTKSPGTKALDFQELLDLMVKNNIITAKMVAELKSLQLPNKHSLLGYLGLATMIMPAAGAQPSAAASPPPPPPAPEEDSHTLSVGMHTVYYIPPSQPGDLPRVRFSSSHEKKDRIDLTLFKRLYTGAQIEIRNNEHLIDAKFDVSEKVILHAVAFAAAQQIDEKSLPQIHAMAQKNLAGADLTNFNRLVSNITSLHHSRTGAVKSPELNPDFFLLNKIYSSFASAPEGIHPHHNFHVLNVDHTAKLEPGEPLPNEVYIQVPINFSSSKFFRERRYPDFVVTPDGRIIRPEDDTLSSGMTTVMGHDVEKPRNIGHIFKVPKKILHSLVYPPVVEALTSKLAIIHAARPFLGTNTDGVNAVEQMEKLPFKINVDEKTRMVSLIMIGTLANNPDVIRRLTSQSDAQPRKISGELYSLDIPWENLDRIDEECSKVLMDSLKARAVAKVKRQGGSIEGVSRHTDIHIENGDVRLRTNDKWTPQTQTIAEMAAFFKPASLSKLEALEYARSEVKRLNSDHLLSAELMKLIANMDAYHGILTNVSPEDQVKAPFADTIRVLETYIKLYSQMGISMGREMPAILLGGEDQIKALIAPGPHSTAIQSGRTGGAARS